MFKIAFSCLCLFTLCTSSVAEAGGCFFRGRSCNRVAAVKVATPVTVQKVVDVQFTPTFVSFVPSQVLLNGQVTTYGAAQSSFGYSYQGGYQDAGQVQSAGNSQSIEARLDRLERLLLKLAGEDVEVQGHNYSVDSYLVTSCKSCHAPGGSGAGAVEMFDETGALKEKLPRYRIYSSVQEGRMPKGGPALKDEKSLDALRLWVHEGLENVEY